MSAVFSPVSLTWSLILFIIWTLNLEDKRSLIVVVRDENRICCSCPDGLCVNIWYCQACPDLGFISNGLKKFKPYPNVIHTIMKLEWSLFQPIFGWMFPVSMRRMGGLNIFLHTHAALMLTFALLLKTAVLILLSFWLTGFGHERVA